MIFIVHGMPDDGRPRYHGMLAGGRRIDGERLRDWHADDELPRLDEQPLFEKNNVRWLRDRHHWPAAKADAYLEFVGGDRLPGRVIDFEGGGDGNRPESAHFIVATPVAVVPSAPSGEFLIRVRREPVERIVWKQVGHVYAPGHAFLLDGQFSHRRRPLTHG